MVGGGPTHPWPETDGKGFWETVDIFYRYLHRNIYYRDVEEICDVMTSVGFETRCEVPGMTSRRKRWLPHSLRRNGFPRASVTVFLAKPANAS